MASEKTSKFGRRCAVASRPIKLNSDWALGKVGVRELESQMASGKNFKYGH